MSENDFSRKVRALRAEHGLTLEQVARHVGVGRSTIRKWETGMIENIRRDKIAKLAEALHTTPDYLMGWDNKSKGEVTLSNDEEQLLDMYRQLNDQGKEYVLQTVTMATHVYTKNVSSSNVENSAG